MAQTTTYTVSAALRAREDFRDACRARDFATVFRLMQKWDGISQDGISSGVEGLTQSRISRILRGADHISGFDVIERIADSLRIPGAFFGLAARDWEAAEVAAPGSTSAASGVAVVHRTPEAPVEVVRAGPVGLNGGPALSDSVPLRAGGGGPVLDTADVVGVFATRHAFATKVSLEELFAGARTIRAAGLSLNVICQQVSHQTLAELVAGGTALRCLFLDPDGAAIATREAEEGHEPQALSMLTRINMSALRRFRGTLAPGQQDRIELAVYDETVRFNILLIDDRIGVVQPYLPSARGLESPTLLLDSRQAEGESLFGVFSSMFDQLWARRQQ